jgi:predicted nucleotidyltransferase
MNFAEPFGGILPGARGAVLSTLLRTGTPLTGRRIHALVSDRHSLGAVQQALRDLEAIGLIITDAVGRAGLHRINETHDAIAALRSLVSPIDMLARVVRESVPDATTVVVFGSAARGDADIDSDIDLAVIAPDSWNGRAELKDAVLTRLGNDCDVLHFTIEEFTRAPQDREPVVAEIMRDGITLVGAMPSPPQRQTS